MFTNIQVINTGNFKLDGGAMFGVVPKTIWSKTNPADENNMCSWAMRCLLIESEKKKILIDTGIGNKQNEKFFKYFYLHGDDSLLNSLENIQVSPNQITDVFFTHLHFDHCGGAVIKKNNRFELLFKNAKMKDLNAFTIESAMKMVAGTARSMGINIIGKFPDSE